MTAIQLRNFANAARQLGSSVAILSSAFHLRERLAQILFLFHENAGELFPRKVQRRPRDPDSAAKPKAKNARKKLARAARYKAPPHVARPTVDENLDPESFPEQLECLATDVTTFLRCLNEFPEFTDEAVNASISSFEGDLKVCGYRLLVEYLTIENAVVLGVLSQGLPR
jgi:WD repeat-containing protein 26